MKILVANLGSTSFKYRLFDMSNEQQLARGGVERIGSPESPCFVEIGSRRHEQVAAVPDHAVAVRQCLAQLTEPDSGCLQRADEVAAIGFKAVHGGRLSGVQRVNEDVLAAMEEMNQVAPAHNPPYIRAMRLLAEQLPEIPLVAAFETGFHQTIPQAGRHYAIPLAWSEEFHIRRFGFHGASHGYIAQRMSQLLGGDRRIVSCHLGGSSSLCAIRDGQSVATTMGLSPQSGLPQNNRVGDFDPFALPIIMQRTNKTLEEVLDELANRGGLLGLSGASGDVRDLEHHADSGDANARLALEVYVSELRRHLGGMLVALGGADAIVFTGGIGENGTRIRLAACQHLDELGIRLDPDRNQDVDGETVISADDSRVQIWVVPTNEELIVAHVNLKNFWQRERVPMFVAKVTGSLVATQKVKSMVGYKMLVVEPYRLDADTRDQLVTTGRTFVAVDTLGAGEGDFVLITQGSSARMTPETKELPIDTVVVGIIDRVQVDNHCVFSRSESE